MEFEHLGSEEQVSSDMRRVETILIYDDFNGDCRKMQLLS